ncbi:MAG: hypothetical protein DRJ03_08270 [Chloroflexi bacterium]|nr:MAG: hypothetical protein DRI81_02955 [Chloroflexota bacterium]RLC86625.1 MAG: hypothetical protein DRJ03_08270 [Chloroflexota bacterium]
MSLARRTITSISWKTVSNLAASAVLFTRSILLARILPVEIFGTYSFAGSIVGISALIVSFGMDWALVHRAPETEDEDLAAATHFTLVLLFTLVWTFLYIAGAFIFASGQRRVALLLITLTTAGTQLLKTPQVILIRRVVHRRLALLQLVNAILPTLIAVGLAWRGATLWALLSINLTTLIVDTIVLYVWKPVWKPHLLWSPARIRYLLGFGSRNILATLLLRVLNEVDDLWTGQFLGEGALGFYSRAYAFACYPSRILAAPVNAVATGSYAELKGQRVRLSKAFFRVNALLVRSGFLFAGLFILAAPEYIRLVLGPKWLPMLGIFRLMLAFTLLDPIKATVGNLFIAVGRPEVVVRARFVQLIILVLGLLVFGTLWGLTGVALAVDAMAVIGMAVLFKQARVHVDFSLGRLFGAPSLALALGMLLTYGVATLPGIFSSDWQTAIVKTALFFLTYSGTLLISERDQISEMWLMFLSLASRKTR